MEKRKLTKLKTQGKLPTKGDKFSVIIKVTKANYIPEPVTLRSKINSYIFTADATPKAIEQLEKDKSVSSVSINQSIQSID